MAHQVVVRLSTSPCQYEKQGTKKQKKKSETTRVPTVRSLISRKGLHNRDIYVEGLGQSCAGSLVVGLRL